MHVISMKTSGGYPLKLMNTHMVENSHIMYMHAAVFLIN